MILNSSKLIGSSILSLHLGAPIGKVVSEIIDPNDLKIIALKINGPQTGNGNFGDILDVRNIREYADIGMIIDSIDELVSYGDIIKIDKVIDLNFSVIGLEVKTKSGAKLGKVIDYTYDPGTMMLMQFTVKRPFIKSFIDPELIINRYDIVEINDYEIIVNDENRKAEKAAPKKEEFVPNFVNPFREGRFAQNDTSLEEDE
jgi:sporulation protein YlmC with PRC-barrel domain